MNEDEKLISPEEFSDQIINSKKYEILGCISRCNDYEYALKLLNSLPLDEEPFIHLSGIVRIEINRRNINEKNRLLNKYQISKWECEKQIKSILQEALAESDKFIFLNKNILKANHGL